MSGADTVVANNTSAVGNTSNTFVNVMNNLPLVGKSEAPQPLGFLNDDFAKGCLLTIGAIVLAPVVATLVGVVVEVMFKIATVAAAFMCAALVIRYLQMNPIYFPGFSIGVSVPVYQRTSYTNYGFNPFSHRVSTRTTSSYFPRAPHWHYATPQRTAAPSQWRYAQPNNGARY